MPAAITAALSTKHNGTASAAWAHERYSWDVVATKYTEFFATVVDRERKN